jgi:DnaJ-class molecular chaperone
VDCLTEPTTTTPCRSCSGMGWKYATHRTALRMVAQSCRDARLTSRRSCVDCGGRGQQATTVS